MLFCKKQKQNTEIMSPLRDKPEIPYSSTHIFLVTETTHSADLLCCKPTFKTRNDFKLVLIL